MSAQYIILVYPPHNADAYAYGPITAEDRNLLLTDYKEIRNKYPGCTIVTMAVEPKTEFYHKM